MPVDYDRKIIFIHVPKTGGSTLEKNLGMVGVKNLYDKRMLIKTPQHLTGKMIEEHLGEDVYNKFFKFSFVRNPYTRAVSDYLWKPSKRIEQFETFHDYLLYVKEVVSNESYYQHPYGDHFIPQHKFMHKVDYIGKFEKYEKHVRELYKKLKLPCKIKFNATNKANKNLNLLTPENKDLIYEIYKQDFIKYKYKK